MTAPQPEALTYSVAEAAALIPMGINQAYAAIKDGTIPSLKLGRSIRIPRRRFHEWLEGSAAPAAA